MTAYAQGQAAEFVPLANEAPTADDPAAVKAAAQSHFMRGLEMLREEAWKPALAEFLESRKLFPTQNATINAGICLNKLQRYDESLAMYERLLRDYPELPPDDKKSAQRAIGELRERTGLLDVLGAEPGAAIVVDGSERGEFPMLEPLRVSSGSHTVRVYKEGYYPFEIRVDVAGGQSAPVTARLRALAESGRLRVVEQAGRTFDVVVDNAAVGKTPFEGVFDIGEHTVNLRDAGRMGTAPARVRVTKTEVASIMLRAEEMDASLEIEPVPVGAKVFIDAVPVGAGRWKGRLRSGPHRVEIMAEGFFPATRQIGLLRNEEKQMPIALERDERAPLWRKPSRITLELRAGLPIAPTLGGPIASGCNSNCNAALGLGGLGVFQGTYELGTGFGIGISTGYMGLGQKTSGHDGTLTPAVNLAGLPATLDDDLGLRGFLAGVLVSLRFGEAFPVTARLGAGGYFAKLHAVREGSFASDGASVSLDAVESNADATYLYVDPEIRIGYRLGDHVEVALGIAALMLIAPSAPTWNKTIQLDAGPAGIGTYSADALTGSFVLLPMPTLGMRYDY